MRPQRNAAENGSRSFQRTRGLSASMRPQRNAAENVGIELAPLAVEESFNEAAA